jgi:hypothetical protein
MGEFYSNHYHYYYIIILFSSGLFFPLLNIIDFIIAFLIFWGAGEVSECKKGSREGEREKEGLSVHFLLFFLYISSPSQH